MPPTTLVQPSPTRAPQHPGSGNSEFWRIADELSRRGFLGGLAGTAGMLGLSACSSDSDTAAGGSSSAAAASTRAIATPKGTVTVPADPKRVACIDPGFSWQTLLEVGVTPVGIPTVIDSITQPANLARAKGIPTVVTGTGEPDFEKLAAVKPDLILANAANVDATTYRRLTAIAPVAAYTFAFPSDWPTLDRSYAGAVNRTDRLTAVTAKYQQRVAAIKDEFGDVIAAQKWALVTESASQAYVWGARSSAGPVLTAAGAAFSAGAPNSSTPFTQLALEKLGTLSDATVILYGQGADGKPFGDTSDLLGQSLFKRLPAARAGNVHPLPSWFAYCYQDALAQLDGIEAVCTKLRAAK